MKMSPQIFLLVGVPVRVYAFLSVSVSVAFIWAGNGDGLSPLTAL